jgi:hypothetical protein
VLIMCLFFLSVNVKSISFRIIFWDYLAYLIALMHALKFVDIYI